MQRIRAPKNAIRWLIVVALFLITVINYVDRQSLSLLAPTIQRELALNDATYAHIVTAFLVAYTVSYLASGRLVDRLGSFAGLAVFAAWWSIAEMLAPFARGAVSLGAGRFLLGLGEAGNYVAAPKVVGEVFEAKDRGLAIGIYTAGATIGATIAPLLVAGLSVRYRWHSVFFVTGIAGLVWLLPWAWLARRTRRECEISRAMDGGAGAPRQALGTWAAVLRRRTTWCLLIARFLTDPVWYFYLFWYPKYVTQYRVSSLAHAGKILWVVYLAADAGTLIGGWLSGWFIRRGRAQLSARRLTMTVAAMVMPLGPLAATALSLKASMGAASAIAFAHMAWLVTLTALAVDEFPAKQVGTAMGVIAAGSGLGGIVATEWIGHVVARSGYVPVFVAMAFLHPLALLFVWMIRKSGARDGVCRAAVETAA